MRLSGVGTIFSPFSFVTQNSVSIGSKEGAPASTTGLYLLCFDGVSMPTGMKLGLLIDQLDDVDDCEADD